MRVQTQCSISNLDLEEMKNYSTDIVTNELMDRFSKECLKILPVEKHPSVTGKETIFVIDSIVFSIDTFKQLIEELETNLNREQFFRIRELMIKK